MMGQAIFVGDHAALDFLNTIAAPHGEVIESISNGEAYLTWLADGGLIEPSEVQKFLMKFGIPAVDRVAREARELREWFRQVIVKSSGAHARWQTGNLISKLNPILAMNCSHQQLEMLDKHLALMEKHEFTRARQLLVPVAQCISDLVTGGDQSLIKCCANPPCTLWFYDRTKTHRRRFCSVAVCGNRVKVAAFRLRQQQLK